MAENSNFPKRSKLSRNQNACTQAAPIVAGLVRVRQCPGEKANDQTPKANENMELDLRFVIESSPKEIRFPSRVIPGYRHVYRSGKSPALSAFSSMSWRVAAS